MTDVSRDLTDADLDVLGPIDDIIVEFPAGTSSFTGEMALRSGRLTRASSSPDLIELN
jgi:hypothetical protein